MLRRAIELAVPAATALEGDDAPLPPVGMSHVIEAVKRTKAPGTISSSTNELTLPTSGGGRGPLGGCVSAPGFQARLVLVAVLTARRRTLHGLPLDSLSPSSTSSYPSPINESPTLEAVAMTYDVSASSIAVVVNRTVFYCTVQQLASFVIYMYH